MIKESDNGNLIVSCLQEILLSKGVLPSHLAIRIGVSHATVSRWLSGKDVPSPRSCEKIAEFSGLPLEKILIAAGHISKKTVIEDEWPTFREYARQKYPNEIDEDLISMIERLITIRKQTK